MISSEMYQDRLNQELISFTMAGNLSKVKELLLLGSDISCVNDIGSNCLDLSAQYGHLDCVKFFLDKKLSINSTNEVGNTPLHSTSFSGHFKISQYLIEHGSNINSVNFFNMTPLHLATLNGFVQIVDLLLSKQAQTNIKSNSGLTPFHLACSNDYIHIAKKLIQVNDYCYTTNNNGGTPLHSSASLGTTKAIEFLLFDCKYDPNPIDLDGNTPLHLAVVDNQIDSINLLLQFGADIFIKNKKRQTALHLAIQHKHTNIISVLSTYKTYYELQKEQNTKTLQSKKMKL